MFPTQPTTIGLNRALQRLGYHGNRLPTIDELVPVMVVADVHDGIASEIVEARRMASFQAAGIAGQVQVLELVAAAPGGVVIENLLAVTTLAAGSDETPSVRVYRVASPVATLPNAGTRIDVGGIDGLSVLSFDSLAAYPSGAHWSMLCPNLNTAAMPGPNPRFWGELPSRVFVPAGQVFRVASVIGQYLSMQLVWRELADLQGGR